MKRLFRFTFYLFLLVIPNFFGITLIAAEFSAVDSSHIVVRQPDAKFADSYRSQKEFTYLQKPPLETNFLKGLIDYIKRILGKWARYSDIIPLVFKLMLWIMAILFLFVVITKTKLYKLFYTDKEIENPDFAFSNPDDHAIDFDEAIRIQIGQQQYREAIRLLYIKLINLLRVKDYINYSKEKTNDDYLCDLTNDDLKSNFHRITSIYNYVWYGDVEIAKDQFLRYEKSFQSFYSAINDQE